LSRTRKKGGVACTDFGKKVERGKEGRRPVSREGERKNIEGGKKQGDLARIRGRGKMRLAGSPREKEKGKKLMEKGGGAASLFRRGDRREK